MTRRKWPVLSILCVGVVLLSSACLPIWQAREMEEQIAALQMRQAELEQEATEREENLAQMVASARTDIVELKEVLAEAREILSRDSANLGADVQRNREEMSLVRGELEALEFRFRRFQEGFDYFREDVDIRFAEEWPTEPEELLRVAQELQDEGDLRRARRAYERFLSQHGDHRMNTAARLQLAEIFFAEQQWINAIGEFQQLLRSESRSTDSQQARSALRIGEAFKAMGECEEASIFFETVVEDFPRSGDVSEARRHLRAIEGGQCR